MTNELLERISQLENQVRRLRRIIVLLALLLVSLLVAGGTTVGLLFLGSRDGEPFMMPWTRQRIMRDRAMLEELEAVRVQAAEEGREEGEPRVVQERELAKEQADEAAKKPGPP